MYTCEQAIADGQLIVESETPEAKEADFKVSLSLTVGVHALVQVPELLFAWQDNSGWCGAPGSCSCGFKGSGEKHFIPFEVIDQTEPRRSATVTLWLCFRSTRASHGAQLATVKFKFCS